MSGGSNVVMLICHRRKPPAASHACFERV
jgi:hypothetical protein